MYKLLKQEGRAKRAEVTTVHGTIQTPVFMNVGTVAAIKGAVSTADLDGTVADAGLKEQCVSLHSELLVEKNTITSSGGKKEFRHF